MTSTKPEEITVSEDLLTKLERDFNEAMQALEGHENFGRFCAEYEKLYRALLKSHESEKRLLKRCQQLTQELMGNAAKMQAAVKLAQGDHSTIEALKIEIDKAWRMVDAANEKNARAKETMKKLNEEVKMLQKLMESGTTLTSTQNSTLEELKLEKKRMQTEYDDLMKQIEVVTKEINETSVKVKEIETETINNQEELRSVAEREKAVQQDYEKELNARDQADAQVRELFILLQQRRKDLKAYEVLQTKLTDAVNSLGAQLTEDQQKRQSLIQKLDTAEKQLFHTHQSYDDAVDTTEALNERYRLVRKGIADAEKKTMEIGAEEQRIRRVKDHDFKDLCRLVQQNDDIRQQHTNLERQELEIKKRIATVQKEKENICSAQKLFLQEHEILKKKSDTEREKMKAVAKIIEMEVESQKEIEKAIFREQEISKNLRQTVARLEKERGNYTKEMSQVMLQQTQAQEELKLATITCEETQRAIDDCDQKLKLQQGRYEQVRSERNLYMKKLIESQDDVVDLKQNFRMMEHQIHQLKEELAVKEKKYQEETSAQNTAKDKLTKMRKIVNDRTVAFDETNRQCENIGQQIRQLVKVLNECDKELSEQRQEFLAVSGERDLLGTQLIRRNEELALLYEKVRIQQEILTNGESEFRERLNDMQLLNLKIAEVKRQSMIAHKRAQNIDQLKEEIKQANYDLRVERTKVHALTEEAENPKNALRWESVVGRNPTSEELEQKITQLQRRLIAKSEECVEKDIELQEKQRLVTELHNILARQPGLEVAQQLNLCHKSLQRKNVLMKEKASELNMTCTHISELKYEAERLRCELRETKRKYYEIKMSNDKLMQGMSKSEQLTT